MFVSRAIPRGRPGHSAAGPGHQLNAGQSINQWANKARGRFVLAATRRPLEGCRRPDSRPVINHSSSAKVLGARRRTVPLRRFCLAESDAALPRPMLARRLIYAKLVPADGPARKTKTKRRGRSSRGGQSGGTLSFRSPLFPRATPRSSLRAECVAGIKGRARRALSRAAHLGVRVCSGGYVETLSAYGLADGYRPAPVHARAPVRIHNRLSAREGGCPRSRLSPLRARCA